MEGKVEAKEVPRAELGGWLWKRMTEKDTLTDNKVSSARLLHESISAREATGARRAGKPSPLVRDGKLVGAPKVIRGE